MTFLQALDTCFRNNDHITRPDWNGKYGFVEDGLLKIDWLKEGRGVYVWTVSEGDFYATDWMVMDDEAN